MPNLSAGAAPGLLAAAFVLLCGLPQLRAQESPIKIAVVDLERVFVLSNEGKQLQAKLEQFQQSVQAEGERLTKAANEIRERAAQGANALSGDKLAANPWGQMK